MIDLTGAKSMRKLLLLPIAIFMLNAGYLNAAPLEKKRISADADWMIHVDYDSFNKSRLGQIIRSEIIKREIEESLKNFKEEFSFHPLDDINNITIYGQGNERQKAITLIQGRFDKSKLLESVNKNPGYSQIKYGQFDIQQWQSTKTAITGDANEQMMFGSLYNKDLIIIGAKLSAIEHAIDVIEGKQPRAADSFFGNRPIHSNNTFMQAIAYNVPNIVGKNTGDLILKNTNRLALEISGNEKNIFANINLTAVSKEATEDIRKLLDGIIAYLTLAGEDKPELAELARKIQISSNENSVQINFEAELEKIKQPIEQLPW
jgi:hypothetical protein